MKFESQVSKPKGCKGARSLAGIARAKPLLLSFLVFSGCMVGPNYHSPENAVSDAWSSESQGAGIEAPQQKWWEVFQDGLLEKYIRLAAEENYDVQAAEANVLQARALRQIAASKLFPQLVADLNGTKTYFSKNGPVFAIGQATGNPGDTTSQITGLPFSVQVPQIQKS